MRESWQDRLLGAKAPNWFALETEQGPELVKMGHSRAVWRVRLATHTVYAKLSETRRWAGRVKSWFLGLPPEREWRASCAARGREVPVVFPLAVGVSARDTGRAVFISEGYEGSVALPTAWENDVVSASPRKRRANAVRLIEAVARLFATAHGRGFVHRDAHPNNVLVRKTSGGKYEAVFADVHGSKQGRAPASRRQMICGLARLDHYFRRKAGRAERLRFFREYTKSLQALEAGAFAGNSERAMLREIAAARAAHARGLARQRDRRLKRPGTYFTKLSLGSDWSVTCALVLERRHVFPEREIPDRTVAEWQDSLRPVIETMSRVASGGAPAAGNGMRFEAMCPAGLLDRLRWTITGSPHSRAFRDSHMQRHRDQDAGLVLGYMEHRKHGLIDATVLVLPDRGVSENRQASSNQGK